MSVLPEAPWHGSNAFVSSDISCDIMHGALSKCRVCTGLSLNHIVYQQLDHGNVYAWYIVFACADAVFRVSEWYCVYYGVWPNEGYNALFLRYCISVIQQYAKNISITLLITIKQLKQRTLNGNFTKMIIHPTNRQNRNTTLQSITKVSHTIVFLLKVQSHKN